MSNVDYNVGYLPYSSPSSPSSPSLLGRVARYKVIIILCLFASAITCFIYQEDGSSSVATITNQIKASQTASQVVLKDPALLISARSRETAVTEVKAQQESKPVKEQLDDNVSPVVHHSAENIEALYNAELDALLLSGDLSEVLE